MNILFLLILLFSIQSNAKAQNTTTNYYIEAKHYLEQNKWYKAQQLFNKVIEIKIETQTYDNELINSYLSLAKLYKLRGKLNDSIAYYRNGIFIKQKVDGANNCINDVYDLSNLYREAKNQNEACTLDKKIISYTLSSLKLPLTSNLNNLNYNRLNDIAKSIKSNISNSNDISNILDKIGQNYSHIDSDLAARALNLALILRLKIYNQADHLAIAHNLDELSELYIQKHNGNLACEFSDKSYKISKKILGSDNIQTINRGCRFAKALITDNKTVKGVEHLNNQYNLCLNKFGPASIYTANIQYILAQYVDNQRAKALLQSAIATMSKNFGSSSATLIPYYDLYAKVLANSNDSQNASLYIAKSKSLQGL